MVAPAWIAAFAGTFEQQDEGEDGTAVSRQRWSGSCASWRAGGTGGPALAGADALDGSAGA